MDTTAHRTLARVRKDLLETFQLGVIGVGIQQPTYAHQMTQDQMNDLCDVAWQIWRIMCEDPNPPHCIQCRQPLEAAATGRSRRYCSDACRSKFYRTQAS